MTTRSRGARIALAGSLAIGLAMFSVSAFGNPGLGGCNGVALVIGNNEYEVSNYKLYASHHDAEQMGDALADLGFEVRTILDADQATFLRGLTEFWRVAAAADVAVIFYSGHSVPLKSGKGDYLIPVDMDETLPHSKGVPLDLVLWAVQPARILRLVIMDADHSEPPRISSEMLFVAYASSPGERTSELSSGLNSLYTSALLHHLRLPVEWWVDDLESVFRSLSFRTRELALDLPSVQVQTPVVYGSFPHEESVSLRVEPCLQRR